MTCNLHTNNVLPHTFRNGVKLVTIEFWQSSTENAQNPSPGTESNIASLLNIVDRLLNEFWRIIYKGLKN